MNLKDLYINFFIEKGHKQIPSAPVVPEMLHQYYLIQLVCNH